MPERSLTYSILSVIITELNSKHMRACEKCGKSSIGGGTRKLLRGHYNPTNWTKKRANLQWTNLLVKGKRSYVCTKCLRTLTKKPK